jgi:ribonucleoside-diphosphate reductase alpha chain
MKPRHTAEQSTTRVNKAEKMGKVGFASVASSLSSMPKAAFDAPLQKSLDILEPAPMVTSAVDTAPVMFKMASKPAPAAEPVAVAAPAAAATAKTATGYQSLASLAQAAQSVDTAQSESSEKPAANFKMVNGRRVFASSDPSEDNICDSCQ